MTDPLPLRRWVIDTNVLVSWVLRPSGGPAQSARRALDLGRLLFSADTHRELVSVMRRSKFDRYAPAHQRVAFLVNLGNLIDWVVPDRPIRACRDPKDDKFLEVAVHGRADALITGDADLLALHPFHGVPVLAPADFAACWASSGPADDDALRAPGLLQEPRAHYKVRKDTGMRRNNPSTRSSRAP